MIKKMDVELILFVQVLRSLKFNVKTFACALENVKNIYIFKEPKNPYNFRAIFHKNCFFKRNRHLIFKLILSVH